MDMISTLFPYSVHDITMLKRKFVKYVLGKRFFRILPPNWSEQYAKDDWVDSGCGRQRPFPVVLDLLLIAVRKRDSLSITEHVTLNMYSRFAVSQIVVNDVNRKNQITSNNARCRECPTIRKWKSNRRLGLSWTDPERMRSATWTCYACRNATVEFAVCHGFSQLWAVSKSAYFRLLFWRCIRLHLPISTLLI